MDRRQLMGFAAAALVLAKTNAAKAEEGAPQFRIGAIADAQYADKDDADIHFYRRSPLKLAEAIGTLNQADIDFAFHLGDFIDGDFKSYDTMLPIARRLRQPLHFVLGNHDFNIAEDKKLGLPQLLGMPARYYSFEHKGWVFVVLDGNDLSTYGWPAGSPQDVESRRIHSETYAQSPTWNGGIGATQIAWLEKILTEADAKGQKVALLCHFPIAPADRDNLWNASEVISRIAPHPSVKLWLNGHNHNGGYAAVSGIHCVTMKGMLDTEQPAYAVLSFYADHIALKGYGRQPDLSLALR